MRESNFNENLQMMSDGFAKLKEDNPELFSEEDGAASNIRELWGFPPKREMVLKEIRSGSDVLEGWDFEVHFLEGAKQYLGLEQYITLEEKFKSIDGIETCVLDGEVFLLKGSSITIEKLQEEVWNGFLAAAFLSQKPV